MNLLLKNFVIKYYNFILRMNKVLKFNDLVQFKDNKSMKLGVYMNYAAKL